jgi:hypothetical protein
MVQVKQWHNGICLRWQSPRVAKLNLLFLLGVAFVMSHFSHQKHRYATEYKIYV